MALIRILVKEGLTGSFYVKNGADFRKSSLIDPTQDKMAQGITAETGYESMKCMCDVDMRGRVRMWSKSEICMFFNSGYAHDRNISIFRRRASTVIELETR